MLPGIHIRVFRRRRLRLFVFIMVIFVCFQVFTYVSDRQTLPAQNPAESQTDVLSDTDQQSEIAESVLERLAVKGRAAKTGYSRSMFSDGWARVGECDVRNSILKRDLHDVHIGLDGCSVLSGILEDPYTARSITFTRGSDTSDHIQIDHVVALSDAWQKGAQNIDQSARFLFANDPLNLLAVDGDTNQAKGDSDAASWLPPNKDYRCRYVARQIAVKAKYSLWITEAEKSTMKQTLHNCPGQQLPIVHE